MVRPCGRGPRPAASAVAEFTSGAHTGMMLIAIGTFFAQATVTGFVGHTAARDRGAASGIYLASYFSGGLVGSAVLGQLFDRFGWAACVAGIAVALAVAAMLAVRLTPIVRLHSGETL